MMWTEIERTREEIVRVSQWLHQRGYIGGMDGNISVRLQDRLLCTPSGVNKGFLTSQDLVMTDLQGHVVSGKGKPSSELEMHLEVYRQRSDVRAVVHAHPPHCVACTLSEVELTRPVVPELAYTLGAVPTAPYATPGTPEVAASIAPHVAFSQAILLARHGSLTVGSTLIEAYNRLEGLEHAAHILYLARNLGPLVPLAQSEVHRLRLSVESRGLPWGYAGQEDDALTQRLVEEVLRRMLSKGA